MANPEHVTINDPAEAPVSRITFALAGVEPNTLVQVYLSEKTRTYEPVARIADDMMDTQQAKGLAGPSEWVLLPVFATGFVPGFFLQDAGVNYATYGPFEITTDASGKLTVDVDDLKHIDGEKKRVPYGYYTVYCVPMSGDTSETGVFLLDASDEEIPSDTDDSGDDKSDSDDDKSNPDTDTNTGNSGGGGGGGCNAGILGAVTLMVGLVPRKRR